MKKKILNSALLAVLISIFAFQGMIITTKAVRPHDFYIVGYIDWDQTTIEYTYNNRFGIYDVTMTWNITDSNLVEDFEDGTMTFNSLRYVHYIQGDVATVRATFEINLNDGDVLISGNIHVIMTDFSDPDNVHTLGAFFGHGDVNIRGTCEAFGISEGVILQGSAW